MESFNNNNNNNNNINNNAPSQVGFKSVFKTFHTLSKLNEDPDIDDTIFCLSNDFNFDQTSHVVGGSNGITKVYAVTESALVLKSQISESAPINDLKFFHNDPNILVTTGRQGSLSLYDIRTGSSVWSHTFGTDDITSMDLHANNQLIAAGYGEDGRLNIIDIRNPKSSRTFEFHSDRISAVQFCPTDSNIVATGSEDMLVNVLNFQLPEDDSLVQGYMINDAVHRLTFAGDIVAVLSTTHRFSLWSQGDLFQDFGDIRALTLPEMTIQYGIGCVVDPQSNFYLFTGSFSGDVNIFKVEPHSLTVQQVIPQAHSSVVRNVAWSFSNNNNALVSVGEDSGINFFRPGNAESSKSYSESLKVDLSSSFSSESDNFSRAPDKKKGKKKKNKNKNRTEGEKQY